MPQFRYTAIDPSSATVNGRIEASGESAVVEHLHAAGQMPLSIEQIGFFPSFSGAELAALFRRRMPGSRSTRRSRFLQTWSNGAARRHACEQFVIA